MIFVKAAYAQCPVCVVTVGGGLILAKKLGIDDALVSIWISGLNTAIAFWFSSTFKNKRFNKPFVWSLAFYILTLVYLQFSKQLWVKGNTLWGIDKILLGMTIGYIVALLAIKIDYIIRKKNNNKVLFYYQKVIIPLVLLSLTTLLLLKVL